MLVKLFAARKLNMDRHSHTFLPVRRVDKITFYVDSESDNQTS